MKSSQSIMEELAALPAEARREAMDFIVFLRQRHGRARERPHEQKPSIKREPFLGIWADRADMRDSIAWVKETREHEWSR